MGDNKIYVSPDMANDLGIIITDKRSRNPNWTDNVSTNHSYMYFLITKKDDFTT